MTKDGLSVRLATEEVAVSAIAGDRPTACVGVKFGDHEQRRAETHAAIAKRVGMNGRRSSGRWAMSRLSQGSS